MRACRGTEMQPDQENGQSTGWSGQVLSSTMGIWGSRPSLPAWIDFQSPSLWVSWGSWVGGGCLVVQEPTGDLSCLRACRNQPGHQVRVRRPPQEEHRGKDRGDAGWRGKGIRPEILAPASLGCLQEFLRAGFGRKPKLAHRRFSVTQKSFWGGSGRGEGPWM